MELQETHANHSFQIQNSLSSLNLGQISFLWLDPINPQSSSNSDLSFQELAKLLEDQHGYIDLQNIPENKYYSMDKNPDEDEKL